jgi:hypothetical protein
METKPLKFNKDLFQSLSESIKKQLEAKGVEEEEILADFEKFRDSEPSSE